MKSKLLYLAAFLAIGIVFSACKEDPPPAPTDEEKQLAKLAKTWVLPASAPTGTVTIQGNDVTADWTNFEITFTDGAYTTSGSPEAAVWPGNGTWAFTEGDVNTLIRDGNVDVSINVSETNLTMSFNYTAGRLDGVEGDWIFKDLEVK